MPLLEAIQAIAGRRLRRVFGPVRHRRYRHEAHRVEREESAHETVATGPWSDDPRWYGRGTPPRLHNRVTPLVDGERFFGDLQESLRGAERYVFVIGWCLTPDIPLTRHDSADFTSSRLLDILAETSARVPVRLLLWSGAQIFFQPTRRTMEAVAATIKNRCTGDLQVRLDYSAHPTHTHHQKAIVVDGQAAYVGGMDLTTYQGDRWDRPGHPLRAGPNWHDVQLRIDGEAVADVEHNFRQRWNAVTRDESLPHVEPEADPAWQTPVQIVRTIPRRVYKFAEGGEYGIRHAYIQAIRGAQRLIYLENQYLWSPTICDELIVAMNRRREEPLRIVIILPARAYDGKWDNDQHVSHLREEDNGRGIVSVYCPYASGPNAGLSPFTYRPIYVHAKVAIVDDEWLTVGSANLNARGLGTDSEINAVVRDPDIARNLRLDLWAEHLALPRDEVARADTCDLIDRVWSERAAANADIIRAADRPLVSQNHRYEIGRMPGARLLEEVESMAVEL